MQDPDYIARFANGSNVGVILGKPSHGLCSIDIDEDGLIESFLELNPRLRATLQTKRLRGCNFWLKIIGDYPKLKPLHHARLKNEKHKPLAIGEWRSTGGQTVIDGEADGLPYRRLVEAAPIKIGFEEINWPEWIADPPTLEKHKAQPAHPTAENIGRLDGAKLENVKQLDGGAVRAACPACRAAGEDSTGEHLLIKPDGKFGCAKYQDDREHRREIWRLAGQLKASAVGGLDADFDEITSVLRGDIIGILMDKTAAPAAQRREVCELVIAALNRVGSFYFHAEFRDFESALFFNRFTKRLERIRADAFISWLSDWLCINRADGFFKYAISAVETESLNPVRSTGIIPESFWASRPGAIYISNGDGNAAKITANGVEIVDNGTDSILFYAGKTCSPWQLVPPQDIFGTCAIFREAHTSAGHAPDLLRAWIYSLPTSPKCKPPLLLVGEVGAGKTALAKSISQFYGIAPAISKVEEMTESNFWPCVNDGGIYTLDNADTRTTWLADTVAAASTDGSSRRRKLYYDAETVILKPRAWLILTSSNPTFGGDSGLADRLLVCRMERRESESSDSALADEIAANRDAGLSHLAETLHKALADTAPTPGGLNHRHPDFAALAVRIGRAIGREAQTVTALRQAEADKSAFCLENDAIATALLTYLANTGQFTGTAKELAPKLQEVDADLVDKLSAKRLGKRLTALWPHLKKQLAAAKQEKDRNHYTIYTLKARPADYAEFQMPFP
jgi:hypothetical protein